MAKNPAEQLIDFGQSVWYDNISREILFNGDLKRLITEWGVRGLTSNPTIFDNAISGGASYDGQIASLKSRNLNTDQVFEELAVADIAAAADLLLPIYKESGGNDGFVSIEVSPILARDTRATVDEAVRLNARLSRPNIMIKIPGTKEGLPAVRECLEQGININITLLFSGKNYTDVANVYCDALKARVRKGQSVDKIRSVASFFVSRVDTIVDQSLDKLIKESPEAAVKEKAQALIGKFGIANCKLAYEEFQNIFNGPAFAEAKAKGAIAQRPLWASTSTKNPKYRDVIYVEELIGDQTVNTMPHATLQAFVDHGKPKDAITTDLAVAHQVKSELHAIGINTDALMDQLQVEGVSKFIDSFKALNKTLDTKLHS